MDKELVEAIKDLADQQRRIADAAEVANLIAAAPKLSLFSPQWYAWGNQQIRDRLSKTVQPQGTQTEGTP